MAVPTSEMGRLFRAVHVLLHASAQGDPTSQPGGGGTRPRPAG